MDITSFLLGYTKGKAIGGGGSSGGDGDFAPTLTYKILKSGEDFTINADGTAVIPHGLNRIPDIIMVIRVTPVGDAETKQLLSAVGYSQRFMDVLLSEQEYPAPMVFNLGGTGSLTNASKLSIEAGDGEYMWDRSRIRKANSTSFTIGSNEIGLTNDKKYQILSIGNLM